MFSWDKKLITRENCVLLYAIVYMGSLIGVNEKMTNERILAKAKELVDTHFNAHVTDSDANVDRFIADMNDFVMITVWMQKVRRMRWEPFHEKHKVIILAILGSDTEHGLDPSVTRLGRVGTALFQPIFS